MVKTDKVWIASLYNLFLLSADIKCLTISTAILSALSSSLPYLGNSPSILKSTAMPRSSLIGVTFAYFIAESESVATESPATPKAIKRSTTVSCNAI